jgi:hypothetical protein
MEQLIAIFGIVFGVGSMVYVIYALLEAFRTWQRSKTTREFSSKLLDRVASGQDLAAVMDSEGGSRLLTMLSDGNNGTPQGRILRALQSGIVLLIVGVGLFGYAFLSPTIPLEGFEITTMLGTLSVSLGIGLLLAAGASFALSKRFGVRHEPSRNRAPGQPV